MSKFKTITYTGRDVEEWLNMPEFTFHSKGYRVISVTYMPETTVTTATWVAVLEKE